MWTRVVVDDQEVIEVRGQPDRVGLGNRFGGQATDFWKPIAT